jgi:hypothetical protein
LDQACRRTHRGTSVRHIAQHYRHGANATVVADRNAAKNLCISTELDIVTQHWNGTIDMAVTYRYALSYCAIGANLGVGMNEYIAEVPDPQAWPNSGGFWEAHTSCGLNQPKS